MTKGPHRFYWFGTAPITGMESDRQGQWPIHVIGACCTRPRASKKPHVPTPPQLQIYLLNKVRVLAATTEIMGDSKRAGFLVHSEPLRAFGYKTVDSWIQEGRTDDVDAYLESFAGGAAGGF